MNNCLLKLENVSVKYSARRGFFKREYYHALKNISFSVNKGETLGIIGRNGCGKSTLLRLLAGIYKEDEGIIHRNTQSVSLLSLNLGFDPELTGKDNALLSSMLLGASKKEAQALLSEILAYAELGEFAYKQVKTYSSGMRARLGFAIAVQMQTDILLIDEVLAVGDVKFRKKAEDTIRNKINSNQTVVLVSHFANQVIALCDRVIWLKDGVVKDSGDPKLVLEEYQKSN